MEEKEIPISKEQMKFYKVDGSHVFDLVMEIDKLQQENKELKQWDKNKDSRNSRQRVELKKLQQENKKLKENRDKAIEFIDKYNTYFNDDISKKPNFVPYIPKEVREILKGDK